MTVTLTVTRALKKDDKLSPQARIVVETIIDKVGVGKPIERTVLIDELKSQGKLQTRQDVGRIVSFYQPRLEEAGLLEKTKTAAEPKTKTAAEPKAKKAAAAPATGKATAGDKAAPQG